MIPATVQHVSRRYIAQGLVVASIVVIAHEVRDRSLQIPWNIIGDLVHFPFYRLMIALDLPIGLRVVR